MELCKHGRTKIKNDLVWTFFYHYMYYPKSQTILRSTIFLLDPNYKVLKFKNTIKIYTKYYLFLLLYSKYTSI